MLAIPTKLSSILGDKTAKAFEKQLGIATLGELLEHFPRRYSTRGELTDFASLPIGETVSVVGEVRSVSTRRMKGKQGSILEVLLSDGTKDLTLAFFNQAWRSKELIPGARGLFSGKVGAFSGKLQLAHPDYELFNTEIDQTDAKAWAMLPIPIYKATGTLTTWKIQKSIVIAVESLIEIADPLPSSLLKSKKLLGLLEALNLVHQPKTEADYRAARNSLRFREALQLQLQLVRRKQNALVAAAEKRFPGELLQAFDSSLPFTLTKGQSEIGEQIFTDLATGSPMHRLLQGEVGSGKTIVALRAVLAVAESGGQSAVLAPTEVLATQHFKSLSEALGPKLSAQLGLRLLTGQMGTAERKKVLLDVASGKCLLVVGTHALISANVGFYDLGLVVIDEQHRFGVSQREQLKAKASKAPHVLTMTATPIPRTLAITIFGDLEISTLTELPSGRKPITSHVVPVSEPALVARVWKRVSEEVQAGRQAFVVCPRIDGKTYEEVAEIDSEELEIHDGPPPASAVEVFEALKLNPALTGLRLGLMHGRLPIDEKAEVMRHFAAGELDVLVSTTVIEVGVNVPNASVMVVLDADRFGISQLHQLRGRVGRGEHAGLCLLVSGAETQSLAMQRLEAVAATNDGFELSEVDLEFRGEGDVLGQMQSGGRSGLKLLRVAKDAKLISETREIAIAMIAEGLSPELTELLDKEDALGLTRS
jgi:ATP-dependent DNA helicase RecG